jgi:hypothetical protein
MVGGRDKLLGLPGTKLSGRSLKNQLKQLVWALARAIVPEPSQEGVRILEAGLEKAHMFYVIN